MESSSSIIDESVDDGISSSAFTEFFAGLDSSILLSSEQQKPTAQLVQEKLKQLNEAWKISSTYPEELSTTNVLEPNISQPTSTQAVEQTNKPAQVPNQQIPAAGGSSAPTVETDSRPSSSAPPMAAGTQGAASPNESGTLQLPNADDPGRRNPVKRRKSFSDEENLDGEKRRRKSARNRRHRSRYYSRSRSRSAESRRRRRRRSRSRSRSRSVSCSSSASYSSERERNRRRRSRRERRSDPQNSMPMATPDFAMFTQTMMSMMQMVNANRTQPASLFPFGNGFPAAVSVPVPPACPTQPTAFESTSHAPPPANDANSTVTQTEPAVTVKESEYDVTTELFLEGKISLADYLPLKPSCREQRTVNPMVCERIKEAISVLERQDAKEHTAKFLYVPPSYYRELRKKDTRSPLIWNNQNVLFGLTSKQREVKLCEPFANVNGKLKVLIAKLGLDEGVISQQLWKAAASGDATRAAVAEAGSSRIQAISALAPKPGSAKVRHVIERAVQTEGYACTKCLERTNKTYISSTTQTQSFSQRTVHTGVQTVASSPNWVRNVPSVSLENLSSSQIETVEAIVRFIRQRQVTGPVDSLLHALNRDSTARLTMGGTEVFHNAHSVLTRMTEAPRQSINAATSGNRYAISIIDQPQQQQAQSWPAGGSGANFTQNPPPVLSSTAGGGRYIHNNAPVLSMPAGYAEGLLSRKTRRRLQRD